jgi:hypothetical protein
MCFFTFYKILSAINILSTSIETWLQYSQCLTPRTILKILLCTDTGFAVRLLVGFLAEFLSTPILYTFEINGKKKTQKAAGVFRPGI